ncbi:MAG TPA: flavodoxin family protein [Bacillota bacterium]|nr:flavodoxin family protein [Peptococcaceae bacterium MAG4]NLW36976.1 flavodoxin family protein [Peptococcaceae bacterium]HPU35614.1 flavodoxin family protein [Bacillota bacterium]HPZ42684.1 flavodoxin family protein [Bacillota bacterium]HQD75672.1 flavodoxin family protein [Bacillota bacterium]
MKVVAFNGSPRPKGNTYHSLNIVLDTLAAEGIQGELVQLGGSGVSGCKACYKCMQTKNKRCAQTGDKMNYFIEKALEADGIIIGSPVYFSNVSSDVKAFIDRCGFVAKANDNMLKGKVGAAVVSVRRAGGTFTYSAINFFFGISEMIIPCSSYWNVGMGLMPGDVLNDQEGVDTFKTLGRNMAQLLKQTR